MAVNIGPKIGIDGEAEYRRQINQIIQQAKTLDSEMKAVTSSFGKDASAKQKAAATTAVLNDQIKTQQKRVELLNRMLRESIAAKGNDSVETQKWRQALNNARADLNRLNNELAETNTKSLPSFSAVMRGAAVAIAGVVAGLKLLGAAVSQFSDFQQLAGGVETLFKESSSAVMEYANNAYKTAGVSANEYLETVTSFSASLIQSLGGDTAEAAKVADVAITDMSDNANKFGTDMTMLQNAYQGFAKQNYTMLDNLKLGYGGTKEEMERLLADAEKLEGAMGRDFDISNFADIVTAIHLVQEEMGVAGATAFEAEKTIEGSTKSMKAAWGNLVAGLGNAEADVGGLANKFVGSLEIMLQNIVPIARQVVSVLPQLAPILGDVVSELLTMLIAFLAESAPVLVTAAIDLGLALVDGIINNLPVILLALGEAALQIGASIINGVVDAVTMLLDLIVAALDMVIVQPIRNLWAAVKEAGANIIRGLWEGITGSWEWLKGKISEWVGNFWSYIKGLLGINSPSDVTEGYGGYLMQGLANGINGSMGVVKKAWNNAAGLISPLSTNASVSVGSGRGAVVTIHNVTFNGYTHEVGAEFVADLNRQLGGLYA